MQAVTNADLRDCYIVFFRNRGNLRVFDYFAVRNRGIGFNQNVFVLAIFNQVKRRIADMSQNLIDDRLYRAIIQNIVQIGFFKV